MKELLFTLLVVIVSYRSMAQSPPSGTPTPEEYTTIMKGIFRSLITNTTGAAPGGFAGLDMAAGKVSFSPAWQINDRNILSGKINAASTEGLAYLFKRELNTNVSLGVEYNFIPRREYFGIFGPTRLMHTDLDQVSSYHGEIEAVKLQFGIDSLKILNGADLLEQRNKLCQKLKADACIDTSCVNAKSLFKNEIKRINSELEKIDSTLCDTNRFKAWKETQLTLAATKRDKALNLLDVDKIKVLDFQIIWFTLGAQVRRDAFKRFDPMLDYADRLIDETYTSHQFYGRFSVYRRPQKENRLKYTRFFSLGFLYNSKSNFQDLNSTEIAIQNDYGSDGTSSMTSSKKYTAYIGEYKKDIDELIINGDYYGFTSDVFAIHLYGTYRMCDEIRPELNLGVGFLHPFRAAKDEKNFVNVEVFYTLFNVWRAIKDDLKLADQGRLGLRFTFPINFN